MITDYSAIVIALHPYSSYKYHKCIWLVTCLVYLKMMTIKLDILTSRLNLIILPDYGPACYLYI